MNDAGVAKLAPSENPMGIKQEAFTGTPTAPTRPAWTGVGLSRPHESAALHVLGQATYTDDIAEVQGTLHAALGLSSKAHANIPAIDLDAVRACGGVVAVWTV